MEIFKNHLIAPYTTINLGGEAELFSICYSEKDLMECVRLATEKKKSIKIISGGSNVIFPDEGFKGMVIKLSGKKINVIEDKIDSVFVNTWAGTEWDSFVEWSVDNELSGIECLSGIPGSCGATVIQNVGAYGQEVCNVIKEVIAFDIDKGEYKNIKNKDCEFGYRTSVFKNKAYRNRYIIVNVVFELSKSQIENYSYPDLKNEIKKNKKYNKYSRLEKLKFVRDAVIKIRRSKSMIYDKSDPDSISCGSFFLNPILNQEQFQNFYRLSKEKNLNPPFFKMDDNYKIPAAFLIESSGFYKGYIKDGAGISKKHSLALVNYGCTAKSLLNLAEEIREKVKNNFGIILQIEPDVVKK